MSAIIQVGFERLTGLSSVKTPTIPNGTTHVWLQAETQAVRVTFDGSTAPTSTVGAVIRADDPPLELSVDLVKNAKFIEESASASLNLIYFGNS